MSENIQSISQGTYTIGQTSATNFVAGPGIKIDEPSVGTVRIGNDETVLWSAATPSPVTSFALSESANLFEKIEVHYQHVDPPYMSNVLLFDGNSSAISIYGFQNGDRTIWLSNTDYNTTNYINYTKQRSWNIGIGQSTESTQKQQISKIIGINRIVGGNA